MHALLLTLMTLGAGGQLSDEVLKDEGVQHANYETYAGGCQSCQTDGGHSAYMSACNRRLLKSSSRYDSVSRMMPQTCYDARYGCYYGGGRHMHRHTAFAGTYYRSPYNYRHYYQWPWHADPHEPTSLFSYNVEREE